MKRLLVLSTLSLALAGCAQSKGALSRGASYPPSPVAVTPVPSVYDTINAGLGGKAVAQTALKNPDDPQWAGRAQATVAARPVPPGPPGRTTATAVAAVDPVPARRRAGRRGPAVDGCTAGGGARRPWLHDRLLPAACRRSTQPAANCADAAASDGGAGRPDHAGPARMPAPGQSPLPPDQSPAVAGLVRSPARHQESPPSVSPRISVRRLRRRLPMDPPPPRPPTSPSARRRRRLPGASCGRAWPGCSGPENRRATRCLGPIPT